MRVNKTLAGIAIGAAALLMPAAAWADSCANVSRAPAPCGTNCTAGPVIQGNWVWLPSVDPTAPAAWGFAPPGALDSTQFGFPGANGNYTNGKTSSLLGVSAICTGATRSDAATTKVRIMTILPPELSSGAKPLTMCILPTHDAAFHDKLVPFWKSPKL